jgi:hypothetical protein
MTAKRHIRFSVLFAALAPFGSMLVGCDSSGNAPPAASTAATPVIAAKPDVIITFDGAHHACVVALYSEAQGSTIPCTDLVPFIRDELRLKSGAIYDTRTDAKADTADIQKATASLNEAGYRFIGGH